MRTLLAALTLFALPALGQPFIFQGEFTQIESQGEACASLFAETQYQTRFFYLESNRTVIVHFDQSSAEASLKGLSLYGRLGYSNDIQLERKLNKNGLAFTYFAEGVVSRDFLLMTLKISAKDEQGRPVCTASAEYSGFPQ